MRGKKIIIALLLALTATLLISSAGFSAPRADVESEHVIIIILDGCYWVKLKTADTPNIDDLIEEGAFTAYCHSVSPSATVITHTSIVTGTYADVHGIVAEDYYFYNETGGYSVKMAGYSEYVEAMTIFEAIEGHDSDMVTALIAAKGKLKMVVGKTGYADEVRDGDVYIPYDPYLKYKYDYDIDGNVTYAFECKIAMDTFTMDEVLDVWGTYEPDLMVVNMPAIDYVGHVYGPKSDYYTRAIEHADKQIGRLLEELPEDVTLIVTADHGMTQRDPNRVVAEYARTIDTLDDAGITHWITDTGGNTGFIWLEDENDLDRALKLLKGDHRFSLLFTKEGIRSKDLDTINLNYPDRSGDIWFQLSDSYVLRFPNYGAHGSLRPTDMHIPLILWGACVKPHTTIPQASIIDIAPTAMSLLGIDPGLLLDSEGEVLSKATEVEELAVSVVIIVREVEKAIITE